MMLDPFYTDSPGARQEPVNRQRRTGPDTLEVQSGTRDVAVREPAPIRPPRPSLRDSVRQRAPRTTADPNRGLFPAPGELDRARDDEPDDLVDMVYQSLRRDPYVTACLRVRGIDLDTVWSMVKAARR